MNNKNARHIPIKLAPKTTNSFTPNVTPITVKHVKIIVVTDVLNPSIPSVKLIAFVVASITNIVNGIYNHIGNVTDVFTKGIIISVPIFITFVRYTVKIVAMTSSPNILYLGFNPSVLFSINFLKSSINPTIPKPTATSISGINFFATSCSPASIDFEYLKYSIPPIISIVIIITIPPIVGVPCFLRCDFGPSSLSCWPIFFLLKIGITIIDIINAIAKASINIFIGYVILNFSFDYLVYYYSFIKWMLYSIYLLIWFMSFSG